MEKDEVGIKKEELSPGEIPAEGNNIAKVADRAFADTPNANTQPPVEKTFKAES